MTTQADTPHNETETRPWGTFEVLRAGTRTKVKTLTVWPGKRTSLQSHRYRREVWTVLEGSMYAHVNGKQFSVLEGQTLHVGYGEIHRIENRGPNDLVICEVQVGSLCVEDDITRYEDDYGRDLHQRQRSSPAEGVRSQIASFIPEL